MRNIECSEKFLIFLIAGHHEKSTKLHYSKYFTSTRSSAEEIRPNRFNFSLQKTAFPKARLKTSCYRHISNIIVQKQSFYVNFIVIPVEKETISLRLVGKNFLSVLIIDAICPKQW